MTLTLNESEPPLCRCHIGVLCPRTSRPPPSVTVCRFLSCRLSSFLSCRLSSLSVVVVVVCLSSMCVVVLEYTFLQVMGLVVSC